MSSLFSMISLTEVRPPPRGAGAPRRASRTAAGAGRGAELVAVLAQVLTRRVLQLGGERARPRRGWRRPSITPITWSIWRGRRRCRCRLHRPPGCELVTYGYVPWSRSSSAPWAPSRSTRSAGRQGGLDQSGGLGQVRGEALAPAHGQRDQRLDLEGWPPNGRSRTALARRHAAFEPGAHEGRVGRSPRRRPDAQGSIGVGRPDAAARWCRARRPPDPPRGPRRGQGGTA